MSFIFAACGHQWLCLWPTVLSLDTIFLSNFIISVTTPQLRTSSVSYHLSICVPKRHIIGYPTNNSTGYIQTGTYFSSNALSPNCSLTNTHIRYLINCYLPFIYLPQKILAEPLRWDRSVSSKITKHISIMKYCHQCNYVSNFLMCWGCSLHCRLLGQGWYLNHLLIART